MKKQLLLAACILIAGMTVAQDLKPKKDKATKKYGYVNKADEWVVQPEYDDADKIRDGFGKIYIKKKEGLINEKGEVVVTPQYDDIEKFRDGVAKVKLDKQYGIIDTQGKPITGTVFVELEDFKNGVAWMRKDELENKKYKTCSYGLIDKTGKEVFAPQFSEIPKFDSKGYAIAEMYENRVIGAPKSYGIIHKDGRIILDLDAKAIAAEENLYIMQRKDGKWVILNSDFKQTGSEYDEFQKSQKGLSESYFMEGFVVAKLNGKYGFVGKNGEQALPFKFDEVNKFQFKQSLCAVREGDYWGYINKQGNYFKKPIYETATSFGVSDAMVRKYYPNIAEGAVYAVVTFNGQECILYNDGKLTEKTTTVPVDDTKPLKKSGSASSAGQSTSASTSSSAESTSSSSTTVTTKPATKPATTTAPAVDDNAWLIGKWTVIEEKMGGKTVTGNKVKFVSWDFNAGGRGEYVERYDVMANQTQTKSMNWSLNGNALKISGSSYTITPSTDKKSMDIKGPLGASWKVKK